MKQESLIHIDHFYARNYHAIDNLYFPAHMLSGKLPGAINYRRVLALNKNSDIPAIYQIPILIGGIKSALDYDALSNTVL